MEFIDLKAQYRFLKERIDKRIGDVLTKGQYIMGPEVKELEDNLSAFCGVRHSIGVANGTDALQLSLMSLDIGPGDAVFTTTFSFFATAEVISLVGATPVFVDIDPQTYNISLSSLKQAYTEVVKGGVLKPKSVIAVDMFGLPAAYTELEGFCGDNHLSLIDDGAQGFGGQIGGKNIGQFGQLTTTSFFPAKPLGCYGDGGAVFTDDDELAARIRSLRVHGKGADKYDNVRIGLNSRLDTIQAAVLLEKLVVFGDELSARQRLAEKYTESLNGTFVTPLTCGDFRCAWAQYTLQAKDNNRQYYMDRLKQAGIPSVVYYGKPLHQQKAFESVKQYVDLSLGEQASQAVFSLPMHPYMADDASDKVIEVLLEK